MQHLGITTALTTGAKKKPPPRLLPHAGAAGSTAAQQEVEKKGGNVQNGRWIISKPASLQELKHDSQLRSDKPDRTRSDLLGCVYLLHSKNTVWLHLTGARTRRRCFYLVVVVKKGHFVKSQLCVCHWGKSKWLVFLWAICNLSAWSQHIQSRSWLSWFILIDFIGILNPISMVKVIYFIFPGFKHPIFVWVLTQSACCVQVFVLNLRVLEAGTETGLGLWMCVHTGSGCGGIKSFDLLPVNRLKITRGGKVTKKKW